MENPLENTQNKTPTPAGGVLRSPAPASPRLIQEAEVTAMIAGKHEEAKHAQEGANLERKHTIFVSDDAMKMLEANSLFLDKEKKVIENKGHGQSLTLEPKNGKSLFTNVYLFTPHQLGVTTVFERDGKRFEFTQFVSLDTGGNFSISTSQEIEKRVA